MPLKLRCPAGHEFMVAANRAGTTVRCAQCDEKIVVPPVARQISSIEEIPPVQQQKPRSTPPELPTRKRNQPPTENQAESDSAGKNQPAEQPAATSRTDKTRSEKKQSSAKQSKKKSAAKKQKQRFRTQPDAEERPVAAPQPTPPPVATKSQPPAPPKTPPPVVKQPAEPEKAKAEKPPAEAPVPNTAPKSTPKPPPAPVTRTTRPAAPPADKSAATTPAATTPAEQPEEETLQPRGYEHKPEHRLWAYGLGAALAALGLFSMSPGVWEIVDFFQHESTTPVAHWAYAVILMGLIQLFYATYVIQFADFSSVWVVAILSLLSATGYALLVGMVLLGAEDVLAMLHLTEAVRTQALLWCFSNLSITATIAYFAGSAGLRWNRDFLQATASPQN